MSGSIPSGRSADRHLLFGILALQMDFISRNALIWRTEPTGTKWRKEPAISWQRVTRW